jgi:hypothetical protein
VTRTLIDTDNATDIAAGRVVLLPNSATWLSSSAIANRFYGTNYRFANTQFGVGTYVEFRPTLPAYGARLRAVPDAPPVLSRPS